MPKKREKLSDEDIKSILDAQIGDASGREDSYLARERADMIRGYFGKKFGNEVPDRSSVVLTDIRDTVEWIMPTLMRIFMGGSETGTYFPRTKEDEAWAKQCSSYANYVIREKNSGYQEFYSWFKDALIERNGIIKYGWCEEAKRVREEYLQIDDEQITMLMRDKSVEVDTHEVVEVPQSTQDPMTGELIEAPPVKMHDIVVYRTIKNAGFRFYCIPPEEFLIEKRADGDLDRASFMAHQCVKTRGELIAMGLPRDIISELRMEDENYTSPEKLERYAVDENQPIDRSSGSDKSRDPILVTEAYLKVDANGDGIQEILRVLCGGGHGNLEIIETEEVDEFPFASITPTPVPHRFWGLGESDMVYDLQIIRSTILRQMLDNMYLTNNQRYGIVSGEVEVDDLMTTRPGGYVRMSQPGMIEPLAQQQLGSAPFNLLEYLHTVKENRTGITRYNQGTDASSLNQTATGISAIMSASQARIDSIARIFGETGIKRLFRAMLRAFKEHADEIKGEIVRIQGSYVPIEPDNWDPNMDVQIEVGVGAGNVETRVAQLTRILEMQANMVKLGLANQVVDPSKHYASAAKVVEEMGYRNPEQFFMNPANAPPPPPPPPDPKMIAAQADMQKKQSEMQMKQAEFEIEKQRFALDQQREMANLEIEKMKADAEIRIKMGLAEADQRLARARFLSDAMLKKGRAEQEFAAREGRHQLEMSQDQESHDQDMRLKESAADHQEDMDERHLEAQQGETDAE
jgi:hypothetical protein